MSLLFFVCVMVTVLMASSVGTALLVRAGQEGQMKVHWARLGLVCLALGLPVLVPFALAAIFTQVWQLLGSAAGLKAEDALRFQLTLWASMLPALCLCLFALWQGWRRLSGR